VFIKPRVAEGVSRIIDSVLGALILNPDRTFVFADMVGEVGAETQDKHWCVC
jgi:hypothetical protein